MTLMPFLIFGPGPARLAEWNVSNPLSITNTKLYDIIVTENTLIYKLSICSR